MRDGLAQVLGSPRELQGLGAVEGGRGADLTLLVGVVLGCMLATVLRLDCISGRLEGQSVAVMVQLTPRRAALAAALACLRPLGLAPPVFTYYASAIALDGTELAKSAAA